MNPKEILFTRIKKCLQNPEIVCATHVDFSATFRNLGLSEDRAIELARYVLDKLGNSADLITTEAEINAYFCTIDVKEVPLTKVLDESMTGRAEIIWSQVSTYFDSKQYQNVVDIGCGDGQVTQFLFDRAKISQVVGVDVKSYPVPGVSVQLQSFNGYDTGFPDAYFDASLMTNVLHHESDNQKLLVEVARILKPGGRLVVIETVPLDETVVAFERNFLNDYLYNRLFHLADVPVPGTYELSGEWPNRFASVGLVLDPSVNPNKIELGIDQPTIRDWHTLYVLTRI